MAVRDAGRIQQIGSPRELYDAPANRFVATFLGTANLVEGRIEGRRFVADGLIVDGIEGPAGPACISIRPQDVSIGDSANVATVSTCEFLGGFTRYRLRLGGHDLIVDVAYRRGGTTAAVGSHVGVVLDPRQIAVLP
jgi:iron(III) transport system ATP-binding protein